MNSRPARISAEERTQLAAYLAEPTLDFSTVYYKQRVTAYARCAPLERLVSMCRARLDGATLRVIAADWQLNRGRVRFLLHRCRRLGRHRLRAAQREYAVPYP
jgi:hypothetical protein